MIEVELSFIILLLLYISVWIYEIGRKLGIKRGLKDEPEEKG